MNTIKCSRCGKMLISEEYDEHYCHPHFKDVQTIVIDYYFEASELDKNGDRIIIGKGLDGILYHWIHCTHNPPHQPRLNTKNDQPPTEQNRLTKNVK